MFVLDGFDSILLALIIIIFSLYWRIVVPFRKVSAPESVEVGEKKKGESRIRRCALSPEKLIDSPEPGVETVFDLIKKSVEHFNNNKCIGSRSLIKVHSQEKKDQHGDVKKWDLYEMGPYQWQTYAEVFKRILNVGSGLRAIGVTPKSRFALYLNTCPEWILTCQALFSQSIVGMTVYANLGEESLLFALNECEIKDMLTSTDLLANLAKIADKCTHLKHLVYVGTPDKKAQDAIQTLENLGTKVFSFSDVEKRGASSPFEPVPPTKNDLAIIMYTSGTTGLPKGVLISHGNLVSTVSGAKMVIKLFPGDVYLAYLPLAHVLELVIENAILCAGTALGYGNPRTLATSAMKNCKGDLEELRPTLMAGVPAVWGKLKKGIEDKIASSGHLAQSIFQFALKYKKKMLSVGYSTPILDRILFAKVKHQLGGRLRAVLSGGAPLSADAQWFLRCILCCPVLQGYGLTETCGASALLSLEHMATERVGAPLPCCEIKLIDIPEMGYLTSDKPYPRGEILISGPSVTLGYFKNEQKTAEDFKDGWFSTGDVGQFFEDGTLAIIDRKKNLLKLSHGEYVAVEKVEAQLLNSPYLDNICLYGDGLQSFTVAILLPSRKSIEKIAEQQGISENYEKLCSNEKIKKVVYQSLLEVSRKSNLKSFEIPQKIFLSSEEWTPENDLTTAALKVKRQNIFKKYRSEIDRMYASSN